MTSSDPFVDLGSYLTGDEARGVAALLDSGANADQALNEVAKARRSQVRSLLTAAGLGLADVPRTVAVLGAIAGAKAARKNSTLVWTMPGNEANVGHLTGEFHRLVTEARQSVTCSTYNFQTTSKMWETLKTASEQPGVVVVIYVDGEKADADKVKKQIPKATIYRSGTLANGQQVVSHAKFVVIDHAVTLLTSANFSFSAEKRNVELGIMIDDSHLSKEIEATMASKHGVLYELV